MSVQDSDLTVDLARDVLGDVAPEELPLFAVTSELYRRDPRAVEAQAGSDDMLGFGADVIAAMAPIVLSVAGEVVSTLLKQLRMAVEGESESAVKALVRRMLRSDRSEAPSGAALTTQQLREVRDVALSRARALNVPEKDAQLLAEAMVGRLATA